MIPLEETVAVLLSAGLSERFGPANKLLAPLEGKPLAAYAAELCTRVPFAARIAVVPPNEAALHALVVGFGFDPVVNPHPEAGKDCSLRLGLVHALTGGARGMLILLGDMPHVEIAHLLALSAAASGGQAAISRAGDVVSPPTLIPAKLARQVIGCTDRSVRESLGQPVHVTAPAWMLADYDRPKHFTRRRTVQP